MHRSAVARVDGLGEIVGEALRHAEVQEGAARPERLALLLEHRDDLGAGHRVRDQGVAERLEGERLAEGDDAVALWGRLRLRVCQIGAHTAGIHERDLGTTGRRRPQLGIGDEVSGRRFDATV